MCSGCSRDEQCAEDVGSVSHLGFYVPVFGGWFCLPDKSNASLVADVCVCTEDVVAKGVAWVDALAAVSRSLYFDFSE